MQVANTQTTYTYTLQNSGAELQIFFCSLGPAENTLEIFDEIFEQRRGLNTFPDCTGATVTYYIKAVNSVGESLLPRTTKAQLQSFTV